MSNQDTSNTARFHSGMLAIIARRNSVVAENHIKAGHHLRTQPADPVAPGLNAAMIFYSPKDKHDTSKLQPLGSPSELGGKVLAGDPRLSGRFDFLQDNMAAGLFLATTGKVEINFPFTEHATILEGEVTLTDEAGQKRTLKAGDSYFVRQGQIVLWEVEGKYVLKSFFNIVAPSL